VQSESGRCPYCRARLAAVSCPSCFALMFAGAAFCEKCGAKRARVTDDDAATPCPGCKNGMRRIAVGELSLLECGECDGVWVDADVFERLCADRDSQSAIVHQLSARGAARAARVQYRPCPRCGKMMNRVNFARLSGTVVDVCRGHGTFLDAGELHAIVTFILGGGLERTRERRREESREEERKLLDAQRKERRDRARQADGKAAGADGASLSDLLDAIRGDL
jgi:Zn-finger nucleic acid-binding protein